VEIEISLMILCYICYEKYFLEKFKKKHRIFFGNAGINFIMEEGKHEK